MKHFFSFLCCCLLAIASYAQNPVAVDPNPQRYIIFSEEIHPYGVLRLDTSCGELVRIDYNTNAKKSKIKKINGCPNVPEGERYAGRFGVLVEKGSTKSGIFMIDHKMGYIWQLNDKTELVLVKQDK